MHLQSSSEFLELLKSAGKGVLTSRDTCRTRRVPGGGSPGGALGTRGELGRYPEGSLGLGTRDTWRARTVSGGFSRREAFGTRGTLGRYPEGSLGARILGHVALSEGIRRVLLARGFRDTWRSR